MKTKEKVYQLLQLICILTIFTSCNNDDNLNKTSLAQITTNPAENISGVNVTLGGNITNNGNCDIIKRGICWSMTSNPVIMSDNFKIEWINQSGNFRFELTNELEPNKLYHARAFCENSVGIQYGNEISFTTGEIINIQSPTDILTTKAKFRGTISQLSSSSSTVGFAYSTTPNPTVNNNVISTTITGSDQFELMVENLKVNTIYYVRAYTTNPQGGYYYSEAKEFRTTGYWGPASGYVAYDKGETTNGWRYLEIYPSTLSSDISRTTGSYWGNNGQLIPGTLPNFGYGLENTVIIANNNTDSKCAAKLCYDATINGYSDWFLASTEEMILISTSLQNAGISIGDYSWTSTQSDAYYAYSIYKNPNKEYVTFLLRVTSGGLNVYPVRRY